MQPVSPVGELLVHRPGVRYWRVWEGFVDLPRGPLNGP